MLTKGNTDRPTIGLFQQVIIQSGTGFCSLSYFGADVMRSIAKEFALKAGCSDIESSEKMLQCFMNMNASVMPLIPEQMYVRTIFAEILPSSYEKKYKDLISFRFGIANRTQSSDPLLKMKMYQMLSSPKYPTIWIIIRPIYRGLSAWPPEKVLAQLAVCEIKVLLITEYVTYLQYGDLLQGTWVTMVCLLKKSTKIINYYYQSRYSIDGTLKFRSWTTFRSHLEHIISAMKKWMLVQQKTWSMYVLPMILLHWTTII